MALQKNLVQINLGAGLDTKNNDQKVIPGKLLKAENIVFTTPGMLRKRNGYRALSTRIQGSSSTIGLGSAVTTFENELNLFSGSELYSYSPLSSQWTDKGSANSINLTVNPVIRNSYQQSSADSAYHSSGLKIFTWEDSRGGSRYSIIDTETGEYLISDNLLSSTASQPKCFALGQYFVIFYNQTSSNSLGYIAIPALSPQAVIPENIVGSFGTFGSIFDGTLVNNALYIAFNNGSNGITLQRLDQFLNLSAPHAYNAEGASCINITNYNYSTSTQSTSWLFVTYYNGSSVKTFSTLTDMVTVTVAVTTLDTQASVVNVAASVDSSVDITAVPGAVQVFYEVDQSQSITISNASPAVATLGAAPSNLFVGFPFTITGPSSSTVPSGMTLGQTYYVTNLLNSTTFNFSASINGPNINTSSSSAGDLTYTPLNPLNYTETTSFSYTSSGTVTTTVAPKVFLRSVGLYSKPFRYLNNVFVGITFQSQLQSTYFVVDQNGKIVSKISPSLGGGLTLCSQLVETNPISTGLYSFASLIKDNLTSQGGNIYTQTGVVDSILNFNSNTAFNTAQLANNLHVSGGILSVYDGTSLVEHGFHVYPEGIYSSQTTVSGLAGLGISDGAPSQYQYCICYEWTDNQGQIQRSSPSIITPTSTITFDTGVTNGSVTLDIPTLRLTDKKPDIRTPVFLTVYRTEANGNIFYQLNNLGLYGTEFLSTINDPTVDYISYTDNQPDSDIIGNPYLYTTGGVIENIAAPATDIMTTYMDRVILIPSENRTSFWYSKQVVSPAPVEFSDLFVQNIDIRGGNITAIGQMDTNLIIFKKTEIFYINGTGPDSTGANNDFINAATLISTDGGSVSPFIAMTPLGMMYKSEKGIYLLTRDHSSQYIGAPVEAYNSANLTSATLMPDTNQVRFTLDSGIALVYDYFVGEWSVFTNHNAADACVFNGNFTYLTPSGVVMQETPGQYTDAGQYIKLRMVTSWLSFASLQGFQRAYRLSVLGEYKSRHLLLVQFAYDFNPTFIQQTYIDAGNLLVTDTYGDESTYGSDSVYGGVFPTYQFQVYLQQQRCEALQISLEDCSELPFGEGLSLSQLGLIAGIKSGMQRLPVSRKFG